MKGFEGGVNAMLKEQKNARNFLHRELRVRMLLFNTKMCYLICEDRIFFHCLIDTCTYLCYHFFIFYVR